MGITEIRFYVDLQEDNGIITLDVADDITLFVLRFYDTVSLEFSKNQPNITDFILGAYPLLSL